MSGIGPTLPPHLLSKRKRDDEDGSDENESDSSTTSSSGKKKRIVGPSLPASFANEVQDTETLKPALQNGSTQTSKDEEKRTVSTVLETTSDSPHDQGRRHSKPLGPTLPPSNIAERPPVESSDEDDDDFGPALPGSEPVMSSSKQQAASKSTADAQAPVKSGRDDWMLAPPTSSGRTSSIDPSKMKNRGFSSGPRAAPKADGNMSLWTETPEEKRKRLEEELLGIRKSDQSDTKTTESAREDAKAAKLAAKVQAYNEKNRAAPLYSAKASDADEDDPSKRAFDRERDIGGSTLSNAERKQMMNKAADFGSRYSKSSYL